MCIMKKMLLIAALAALALGASAQDYKLEKVWEINDVSFLPTLDSRQGFGMNGKFYINNKKQSVDTIDGVEVITVPTIYEIDENGLTGVTFDGGRNAAITHDEAGNIITSNAGFGSTMWNEQTFTVLNPTTGESKTYTIPNETGLQGRCDFFGFPKGDLMEDGELYITAATSDGQTVTDRVLRIKITDGELDTDNTYVATCDGLVKPQSSTVINYYVDKNGEEALMYAYRSGNPAKLVADGDNFAYTSIVLPDLDESTNKKGHANGVFPLIWDGKEMFIYPLMPDYRDGWAISEAGAAAPLVAVTATATANCNSFQCNWLNAEVDATGVTIYQYAPGYCLRVWRLTKEMVYTVVGPENVFGSNWKPDDENNDMVMGEDSIYTWSAEGVALYGDLEFKVVGNHDYSIYEWPMGQNNWVAHLPNGEAIYDILITFDPTADDADRITCTLTKVGDVTPIEHTYTVAGTENLFGSNWDPTDANNDMVKGEDGIYTWSAEGVIFREDVHIEFKVVQDHSWAVNWPTQNWKVDLEAGTYDIVITFDPAAEMDKITFTATRTDVPPVGLRGDVNLDGQVAVDDATLLIDILLSGGEAPASADANLDEEIGISDVTTIIDYLLSGVWPD